MIDNKIPEEKIVARLLTSRGDDFAAFKRFLIEDSGPQGVQAFDDIKAQVLRGALEKATNTMGKGEKGQVIFSKKLFSQQFAQLRASKKYNQLFNEAERKLIEDIEKLGSFRIPQRLAQQKSLSKKVYPDTH